MSSSLSSTNTLAAQRRVELRAQLGRCLPSHVSIDLFVNILDLFVQLNMEPLQLFVHPAYLSPNHPQGFVKTLYQGFVNPAWQRYGKRKRGWFGSREPHLLPRAHARALQRSVQVFAQNTHINIKLIIYVFQNPTFSAFWKIMTFSPSQFSATPIWPNPRGFVET